MSDQGQKTEKPTKRRLDKAREEGRFPFSREFAGAIQFLGFVWIFSIFSGWLLSTLREFTHAVFAEAFHLQMNRSGVVRLYREALFGIFGPLLLAGVCLTFIMFATQMGATQMGFALQKLTPEFSRLNPAARLKDLPQQGMLAVTQAVLLLPIFGFAVYKIAAASLDSYLSLSGMSLGPALEITGDSYFHLLWRSGFILLLLGTIDLVRQRRRHAKTLKMTKQEIKEEYKQMEGNPQIKQRIRRIQRDLARRNMMKEVPNATAVLVNPTHFSVAIRYDMESPGAPRVVAKGKNYLALRIRQIATEHNVPIIENQPLAQALYKSADVGQEIPPDLYRAVAEILAYVFKLMNQGRR